MSLVNTSSYSNFQDAPLGGILAPKRIVPQKDRMQIIDVHHNTVNCRHEKTQVRLIASRYSCLCDYIWQFYNCFSLVHK